MSAKYQPDGATPNMSFAVSGPEWPVDLKGNKEITGNLKAIGEEMDTVKMG